MNKADLPPLNDDLRKILGRVCFQCITIAELLRASGQEIPHKAEEEQAAVIYWLLGLYLEHGAAWASKAQEALVQMRIATLPATASALNAGGP